MAGHQDDNGVEELDHWATLNIEMDSLAKIYWNDMCDNQTANIPIAEEYWMVRIDGEKVTLKLDEHICDHILGNSVIDGKGRVGSQGKVYQGSIGKHVKKQ